MRPTVQWRGDNAAEVEHLLRNHLARADKHGDKLHVMGLGGLDITLELGDSVVIEDDRLGVMRRQPQEGPEQWVTWDGNNLGKVAQFLIGWDVRPDVVGADLFLYAKTGGYLVLKRGDRLVKRHGEIVISKGGKDHRV